MHFVLLALGILIGLYGLYRFFLTANVKQISAFLMTGGFLVICIALFYLAVTGRLPAALGLCVALWPLILSFMHKRKQKRNTQDTASRENISMTKEEAYEILGITHEATEQEIKSAYNKLMKKVHPDQEGSKWMAAKLNQAKDTLLN
jgi:hypothetical protein